MVAMWVWRFMWFRTLLCGQPDPGIVGTLLLLFLLSSMLKIWIVYVCFSYANTCISCHPWYLKDHYAFSFLVHFSLWHYFPSLVAALHSCNIWHSFSSSDMTSKKKIAFQVCCYNFSRLMWEIVFLLIYINGCNWFASPKRQYACQECHRLKLIISAHSCICWHTLLKSIEIQVKFE